MDYELVLDPRLGINPEDFASAWNKDLDANKAATLRLGESQNLSFAEPVTTILISIAVGVAANLLTDLIKRVATGRGASQNIRVDYLDEPDGKRTVVVSIDEG